MQGENFSNEQQLRIAVVGCCHGELDEIYRCLRLDEQQTGQKVDLLLICGDFQAVRNYEDLHQMAVPPKFRKLNTFYKYYSGEEVAPVLTLFIGGNHEASGFLQELPYGGWVAPNIYYLGYSGVVQFGGLRIAGLSGIFKPHDYNRGHHERPPYTEETKRSCYHVRALDVYRMKHIREEVDIFLSHDWPLCVYHYGNVNGLLRAKPYFQREISSNTLGNPHTWDLLRALRPGRWFAAHLHCHFKAWVPHGEVQANGRPERLTEFSALNKVLPGRRFLEIFNVASKSDKVLRYDPEWLAILRGTDKFMSLQPGYLHLPQEYPNGVSEQEKKEVSDIFRNDMTVPINFVHTSPPMEKNHQNQAEGDRNPSQGNLQRNAIYVNPQTERLSQLLNVIHPFKVFASSLFSEASSSDHVVEKQPDPNEINLEDGDEDGETGCAVVEKLLDPNEIDISDNEEEEEDVGVTAERMADRNEINIDKDEQIIEARKQTDPNDQNAEISRETKVGVSTDEVPASGNAETNETNDPMGNGTIVVGSVDEIDLETKKESFCGSGENDPKRIKRDG